jgi:hypothetical protein
MNQDNAPEENEGIHISELPIPRKKEKAVAVGHNSQEPTLSSGIQEIIKIDEMKKELGRQQRDIKAALREKHTLSVGAINLYVSLAKKDAATANTVLHDLKRIDENTQLNLFAGILGEERAELSATKPVFKGITKKA